MIFGKFSKLCSHHQHSVLEHFNTPNACLQWILPGLSHSRQPLSVSLDLPFPDISYEFNYTIYVISCLASFIWYNISEVCPLSMWQHVWLFHLFLLLNSISLYRYPFTIWIVFFFLLWQMLLWLFNYFYTSFCTVKIKLDFGKINKDYSKTTFKNGDCT